MSTEFTANPKETKGEIYIDNIVCNIVGGSKITNNTKGKNQAKTTKSKILVKSKNHDFPKSRTGKTRTGFLTPKARLMFIQLRQEFVKTPILYYLDPKSHIQIKTDLLDYAICSILSQLSSEIKPNRVVTKANLGQ